MNIKELLKQIHYIEVVGDRDKTINHITLDSREATKDSVFIAIEGFKTDGHKFIEKAIENECKIIVHTKDIEKEKEVTYIKVEDGRLSLAEISKAYYNNPSREMTIVGITGTNGKTTTTYMLECILKEAQIKTATIGTMGLKKGDKIENLGKTTPESNKLQEIFHELSQEDYEAVVMEVSSHALELKRVEGTDFDYSAFTNLTYEHLELHGSMENYYQAKKKLFAMISKENIINIDDSYGERLYNELKEEGRKVLSYSMEKPADLVAKIEHMDLEGTSFIYKERDLEEKFEIPIAGKYNIYNAVAAVAIALRMKVEIEDIKKGLQNFEKPEGRYQVVKNHQGLNLIIDFAHTSDGMESIIKSAKENFHKNTIVVFGVSGARTVETQEEIGRVVGNIADYSIVTKDDEIEMEVKDISKNIIRGIEKSGGKYEYFPDREEAIERAVEMATSDDVVLFLGKGNEKFFKTLGGSKVPYDEEKAVMEALKKKEQKGETF